MVPFVAFAFTSSRGLMLCLFVNPTMLQICATIYLITWVTENTFRIWKKRKKKGMGSNFPLLDLNERALWLLKVVVEPSFSGNLWPLTVALGQKSISWTTSFHAHAWKCGLFHWEPWRQHSLIHKRHKGTWNSDAIVKVPKELCSMLC